MKKVNNKKGFTLAELLVVVAIIAILIAIAIPVFGSALDSAKRAADDANIRAAYAEYTSTKMAADDFTGSVPQASATDAQDALDALGVTQLQYYNEIVIPATGAWTGGAHDSQGTAIASVTYTRS